MPVFACPHCGQSIDADDTFAGMEATCPSCQSAIQVPAAYSPYQPPKASSPPPLSRSASPAPHKRRTSAAAWGTVIALVLCAVKKLTEPASSLDTALGNTGFASIFGGTIGYTLAAAIFATVIALVIAGIAAAFKKSFKYVLALSYGIGVVLLSLLMLALSLLTPHLVRPQPSQAESSRRSREQLNQLQADIQKMQAGVMPAKSSTPAPPPDSASDQEKVVQITREYFEAVAAGQKGYIDELTKSGFLRLLDANRVKADTDFSESYAILARARALVKEHSAKIREALSSLPARVRASTLSPSMKESTAQGAERGMQSALIAFDENWSLEASCVDHFTTIIDLLSTHPDHWQVENNKFAFTDEKDLETFNATMGKISAVAARQEEIKQKGAQKTGKTFDDFRSALPK